MKGDCDLNDLKLQSERELQYLEDFTNDRIKAIRNHFNRVRTRFPPEWLQITIGDITDNGGSVEISDDGFDLIVKMPSNLIRGDKQQKRGVVHHTKDLLQSTCLEGSAAINPSFNNVSAINGSVTVEQSTTKRRPKSIRLSNKKKYIQIASMPSQQFANPNLDPRSGAKGGSNLKNVTEATQTSRLRNIENIMKTPVVSLPTSKMFDLKAARKPIPGEKILTVHLSEKGTPLLIG